MLRDEGLMNMTQVAKYIGVSKRSVERWIKDGVIPEDMIIKIGKPHPTRFGHGRLVRIRKSDLDKWLQNANKEVKSNE